MALVCGDMRICATIDFVGRKMTATVPTIEPTSVRAGLTWEWDRTNLSSDYPASTWTLKYGLKNAASHIEITAAADGDDYTVLVAAATTAGYTAGTYRWAAWVESGTEKRDIGEGWIEVLAAYTGAAVLDDRSHARITLDAIEAVIENRATLDQQQYAIGNRSLTRTPIAELLKLRDYYRAEVRAEVHAEDTALGRGGHQLLTRF